MTQDKIASVFDYWMTTRCGCARTLTILCVWGHLTCLYTNVIWWDWACIITIRSWHFKCIICANRVRKCCCSPSPCCCYAKNEFMCVTLFFFILWNYLFYITHGLVYCNVCTPYLLWFSPYHVEINSQWIDFNDSIVYQKVDLFTE